MRADTYEMAGVMMTNVAYQAYGDVPAAFSTELVAQAHAQGLMVMTDDLAIPVLSEAAGGRPEEVVTRAFLAGNDLLMTTLPIGGQATPDYVGVLVELVREQPALQGRVDDSVWRILRAKQKVGLIPSVSEAPE